MQMQIGQILAELELLSHGSVTAWNHAGGGGVPASREPSGELRPPHEHFRARYNAACGPVSRERVRSEAQEALEAWRVRSVPAEATPESVGDLEARVVAEGEGWDVAETAIHCRVTATFVRKARANAVLNAQLESVAERDQALELVGRGLTGRQIRMIMKIGGSKLDRLLA